MAPDHPEALFNLGQHALYRKDAKAAVQMLERAQQMAPREPAVALNLSFAHRALGDVHAEGAALTVALAIDPYFYPAMLAKAALIERAGDKRQAARIYKDVLTIAPPEDRLPRELKAQIEHARTRVRENAEEMTAFLAGRMGPCARASRRRRFQPLRRMQRRGRRHEESVHPAAHHAACAALARDPIL